MAENEMRVKSFTGFELHGSNKFSTYASVEVPGLGEIKIEGCVSSETVKAIKAQTIEAVRIKLNLKCESIKGIAK